MGAYYTKEDITEYIAKNTVIPYLFDAAQKKCAIAFQPDSALWRLLRDDPDRYIYAPVCKGVDLQLPEGIARGIADVLQRDGWNRPAAPAFALPTETWREHIARRQRCQELRARLQAGEVHQINDLITYNLDLRQFAEDVISDCEGPELLRAFYQAISTVTVLDPTCGSGAFLFAALNILEPLYEACLDRMQAFIDDLDRSGERPHPARFADFRRTLAEVDRHPNRHYFILKSIMVNNLYGVDIMEEAVEICKLRLFLKLVAQVDRVKDLEPLPDIDFNIRPGNTLVGFATLDDVKRTVDPLGLYKNQVNRVVEEAEIVERAFQKFHEMQTDYGMDAHDFAVAKQGLRSRLAALTDELDRYLADTYSVSPSNAAEAYEQWHKSYQPFHWFAEFYGIMSRGGFDVIIGNPPWREYSVVRRTYQVRGYSTEVCGNLHGICTERALVLRSGIGRMSFIVQLPLASSSRMESVRSVLRQHSNSLYAIPFDDRPGKLFEGLQHCRSVIFLSEAPRKSEAFLFTTRYQRWPTQSRPCLFSQIEYARAFKAALHPTLFPKYATDLEIEIFAKVLEKSNTTIGSMTARRPTKHFIFYQEATQYWVKATIGLPYYAKDGVVGPPAHGRYVYFDEIQTVAAAGAILNSSLFYLYFIAYGDCFHLSDTLVSGFPIPNGLLADRLLVDLGKRLQTSLNANAECKTIQTRDGSEITYAEFFASKSKSIIDEIDSILAKHYDLTNAELDFVINYDIKYRMGQDEVDEE
jgi:hypothetical protein